MTELDRPNEPLTRLLRFEAERARGLLAAGERLREAIGGRVGRGVGPVRERRPRRPRGARERALGHLHAASSPLPGTARAGRGGGTRPMTVAVEQAYAEVERLTRARARNFSYGIRLLPKAKRRAIAAIYAFAREVDDVADDPLRRGREARPPRGTRRIARRRTGRLGDVRRTRGRPRALPDPQRRAARSRRGRPAGHGAGPLCRLRRARGYCRRVAGAVGVACIAVYGADQPQRAEAMGIALQLINIMRDVDEDWSLGRVYIPQDELASFGVTEGDIAAGRCSSAWQALMAYQAARARPTSRRGERCCPTSTAAAARASPRSRTSTRRRWSGSRPPASTSSAAPRVSRR